MTKNSLFNHQKISIRFLASRKAAFDASDPGTGKTRVQIEDFAARRRKKGGPALILAPKSLLDSAWKQDFLKFAPDMRVVCAYSHNRAAALALDADVYVVNHDGVKALKPAFLKKFKNGTLIIDESSAFKHHTSSRSKALRAVAKHFEYRRCMSGTPTSNGITNIWHQVYILDGGKALGPTFSGFRNAACIPEQAGPQAHMIKWIDRPGIELTVAAMLKDIMIRHRFEDCVDIPPNHQYSVSFDLSPSHMKTYQKMERESLLELKGQTIDAVNGAVLYGKLLQIASGAVYGTNDGYSLINTDRYELVMDLVEAREHSIVFFNWKHQRDELIKLATSKGMAFALYDGSVNDATRRSVVEDYQRGKFQVLFAHPQSAGHGLTLTKGTATIWASPTYNLEHFKQGLKRIHRIGQTDKTETIVVLARGTVDEKVWNVLNTKDARQGDLLNELL
jgi:SNF2 family DNA or RNA helicase